MTRRPSRGTARDRRASVRPRSPSGGLRIRWISVAVLFGIIAIAGAVVAYVVIQAGRSARDRYAHAAVIELDPAPDLPGQYVNLPEAFADGNTLAHYHASAGPNTNAHVMRNVDYTKEGLPPAGGPHWGAGSCGKDPRNSPSFCGPVAWGIYRDSWQPESLVHNMEHAGVIVWYNFADTRTRDSLEALVEDRLKAGKLVVMAPYAELPPDTIALTAWSRRDEFPTSQYDESRVKQFIDTFSRRFNPENF